MKKLLLLCFCTFFITAAYAQKGTFEGIIIEDGNDETVIGATIGIPGTAIGTATDIDGVFRLQAAPGKYTFTVRAAGYQILELPDIIIEAGKTVKRKISLKTETKELEGVVISAKADKESESILLMERKEATEVVQKIGAQEMSRKGVSNVAEGVTKVVGVSTPSNKVVVVRGLGDRYNNVTINGLPVPSTNPDQKVIPLHIFPAGAIKNLAVSKSYAPTHYGDFAGGMIDILTKDYTETHFLQVGASIGGNSITTGKHFLYSTSSAAGYSANASLGYAAPARQLPPSVAVTRYYDSRELGVLSSPFATGFSPKVSKASPAYGFNFATGNFIKSGKSGGGFGYYATFRHKNEQKYTPGMLALYNAQQSSRYRYNTDNYNYTANTTGLVNLMYKFNHKHSIGFTSLYVNDASDNWIVLRGTDNDLGELYSRRNTYTQNTLFTNQLYGKHEVSALDKISWGVSWSNTKGNMPDRLQNTFRVSEIPGGVLYTFAADAVSNNHRFFGTLNDNEYSGKLEWTHEDKEKTSGFTQLTAGLNGRYKYRVFGSRQIDMKIAGGDTVDPENVDAAFQGRTLGDGVATGSYKYVESYYAPNNYEASLAMASGYLNAVYKAGKWQFIAGLRAEYASQVVFYKRGRDTYDAPYRKTDLTGIDFMPAVTVKRELTEKANLLFAASRTITRPQFVELGPFRYNESFGTQEREGNPLLKNGTNYNLDIKYEWYPSPSEILSLNLLGKYMLDPIEMVIVASADPLLTYVNTDRAVIGGVEFEYTRNLGKWLGSRTGFLNNSTFGFNAAYLYSQIEIGDLSKIKSNAPVALTNTRRPLMGASPYIVNVDYSYRHNWTKDNSSFSQLTVTYNVFGKRVFAAGSQGAGDIYEMPVNTFDLILTNELKSGFSFNVNIGNIFNPDIVQQQQFNNGSLDVLRYKRGLDFGLSLAYRF